MIPVKGHLSPRRVVRQVKTIPARGAGQQRERTGLPFMGLIVVGIPCLVTCGMVLLSGEWPNANHAPEHPAGRFNARLLITRPVVPLLSETPHAAPEAAPTGAITPDSFERPSAAYDFAVKPPKAVTVPEYVRWLAQTDRDKAAMFRRASELVPRLQQALAGGASRSEPQREREPAADAAGAAGAAEYSAVLPTGEWDSFIDRVERQPYPPACRALHDRYILHLKALRGLFVVAMETLDPPSGAAPAIKQSRQPGLDDDAMARARQESTEATGAAQDALAEICQQAGLPQTLTIVSADLL